MNTRLLLLLGTLLLLFSTAVIHVHAKTASEVFDTVSSSIVVIQTYDAKGKAQNYGSGVVLAKDLIATNYHVIEGAASIRVVHKGKTYPASLRHSDRDRDVCTLTAKRISAPAAVTGSTSRLKVGTRVYAIGAPQGLELTLSEGIISSLRSVAGGQYIQITAPISPGSSGGGLFDEEGRLIGLPTFYLTEGQQLNFAVPVEWISELPGRHKDPLEAVVITTTDWINKAVELEEKKDWAKMIAHSLRWTDAQPSEAFAWFCLGIAYWKSNLVSEAIESYAQALRIDPEDASAWLNMGLAYGKSGRTAREIECYQQALRIKPNNSKAWFCLGVTHHKSGQTSKAIAAYNQGLGIDPGNADIWRFLGDAYYESDQRQNAIESYHQALRIDPKDDIVWYRIGVTYARSGQASKAVEYYQQALSINPQNKDAWYFMGYAYRISGQTSKVMEVYQRLKKLDPVKAEQFFSEIVLPDSAFPSEGTRIQKGRLYVDIYPPFAQIELLPFYINGGYPPAPAFYQGIELRPGVYNIVVSANLHKMKAISVRIEASQDTRLRVALEPTR